MTTATAEPPTAAATREEFLTMFLHQVVPSKTNPRTHFDDTYIDELARSIADKGLIQPIIVRPLAKAVNGANFEIVAGECRYRATQRAQLPTIAAIARSYTNEQVLELQLVENMHRTDLTPLEQAVGYRRLIASNPTKHSAESIAARIGMSPAYVWDRLKLNDLVPEAKQLLETGHISVGHAILIARLKPEQQTKVIKPPADMHSFGSRGRSGLWLGDEAGLPFDAATGKRQRTSPYDGFKPKTVRELEHWIADHIRFDVEHAAKAQPLTFEQTAADVRHAAALPGRGKKVVSITHDYRVGDDARDDKERTIGQNGWKRADGQAKSKTCDHSVLGVIVAGRGYGETFEVCVAKDKCTVHWAAEIKEREKNRKLRESGQGKKAAKREQSSYEAQQARWKREAEERDRRYKAWEAIRERAVERLAAALKKAGPTMKVLGALMSTVRLRGDDLKLFNRLFPKTTGENVAVALLFAYILDDDARDLGEFKKIATVHGVDLKDLEAEYQQLAAPPKPAKASEKKPAAKKATKR